MNPGTHMLQAMDKLKPQKLADITYANILVKHWKFLDFFKAIKKGHDLPT